jgi:phosphoribosylaminoimidazolecarboxamide formyltransferase / IMP cyclohydrolase
MTQSFIRPPTQPAIRRALLSVSDKTGLVDFARRLAAFGVDIISTGGTAKVLQEEGVAVQDVAAVTGFPEIMDGRVKTLHPKIHGGLLAKRSDRAHGQAQHEHGIANIDLLVVNLYPFEATVARGAGDTEIIENIDVGGPAMIRAAAKNHADVTVIVEPSDYEMVLAEMDALKGATTHATRQLLAAKAFARTAAYDSAIARWFDRLTRTPLPVFYTTGGRQVQALRYGENPHQHAAVYKTDDLRLGILDAKQLQGKEMSYNNINDADAALQAVAEFPRSQSAACVIVKHANPCGVATAGSVGEAYRKALACDATSAFGGIVAFNKPITAEAAIEIAKIFTEVILAPGIDDDALAILSAKKNLRLLLLKSLPDPAAPATVVKSVTGGLLVQSSDRTTAMDLEVKTVTHRQPTETEMRDMLFAYSVAKHVKSNAIVFAKDGATTGIGAGQMSRIDSTRIAVRKSEDAAAALGLASPLVKGSVLASDAFFPFADGIEAAAEAGATAIIQPGGSLKDAEVIAAADKAGLAMVFTGVRHFRH